MRGTIGGSNVAWARYVLRVTIMERMPRTSKIFFIVVALAVSQ
jgi:hypothetical protein